MIMNNPLPTSTPTKVEISRWESGVIRKGGFWEKRPKNHLFINTDFMFDIQPWLGDLTALMCLVKLLQKFS